MISEDDEVLDYDDVILILWVVILQVLDDLELD